jgi:hypothetical protein
MNPIQIDTSTVATDAIDYVATDQNGLTSTTTRTVIIEAALRIVRRTTPQHPKQLLRLNKSRRRDASRQREFRLWNNI